MTRLGPKGDNGATGTVGAGGAVAPNPGYLVTGTDASVYQEAGSDPDLWVAAVLLKPTGTAKGGVLFRGIDDANYLVATIGADDTVRLYKREGGTFTELASAARTLGSEEEIRAQIVGDWVFVEISNEAVLRHELGDDAAVFGQDVDPLPKRVGLYSSDTGGPRFYYFEAKSLSTPETRIHDHFGRLESTTSIGGPWVVQSGTWGIEADTAEHTVEGRVTRIGSPEGVVSAPVGTLYTRLDGGAGTTLYVKESGTGNTGWIPK